MRELFTNDKTGENVEGITIMIDGVLKQVFDKIMQENREIYTDYATLLQDALMNGIRDIIKR